MTDDLSCPWCSYSIDLDTFPFSEETAERRLRRHKSRCPNRNSYAHSRSHLDVHGQNDFGSNSNQ